MTRFAVIALFSAAPAFAGVSLSMELTTDKSTITTTMSVEGEKARVEDGEGKMITLFDGATRTLRVLMPREKRYQEITAEDLKRFKAMLDNAAPMMKAAMEHMPPEQRKQMEAVMAKAPPPDKMAEAAKTPWKFEKTGKKTKIGEFDCEVYAGTKGDAKADLCAASWSATKINKDDVKALAALSNFLQEGFGQVQAQSQGGVESEFSQFPGLPVRMVTTKADGSKTTSLLKSVKKGALDKATFELPAGYEKMSGAAQMHMKGNVPMHE